MATVEGCYAHDPLRRCLYDNKHCLPHLTPFTRPVYCILFIHGGLPVLPGWLVSCTGLSQCLEISLSLGQLPWRVRFREVGCRCREPLVKFGCFFASWDAFPVPRCQRVFQELTEGTERWGLVLGFDGVCHFPACLPLGSAQVTLS